MRAGPTKKDSTYEVVGDLVRVDERDTVFARAYLKRGSAREREYHSVHPGTEEIDLKMGKFYQRDEDPGFEAVFGPIESLALPDVVDGPVSDEKVVRTPVEFTSLVKRLALELGANQVGTGLLNQAWIYSHRGRHPYFEGYESRPLFTGLPHKYTGLAWGDPIEIDHKHVIALGFAQDRGSLGYGTSAETDLEVGKVYARSALVAVQLARFIRELGYPARAHHLRNYGLMVVPAAVDCGLGELARCGYVVSRTYGANMRIVCVSTDLPLEPDPQRDIGIQDFCAKCLKCAKACPAQAIPFGEKVVVRGVRKWEIDREKCFLYWGAKGHSCAICQMVCPWTKPDTLIHTAVSALAIHVPLSRRLIVRMDSLLFPIHRTNHPED